ncbi:MAG: O-antigen ligase family protein, partial [Propionibacteriaceae bacterium]|nr:O-antigen ligase family protein [Propionibacteriaceae bacterium]
NLDRFMVPLSERPAVWGFVVPRIAESPVIGHGSGALPMLRDTEGMLQVRVGHAHNMVVQELFAGGIIGLLLMLAIVWIALSRGVSELEAGRSATLALALFAWVSASFDLVISGLVSTQSTLTLTLLCVAAAAAGRRTAATTTPAEPAVPGKQGAA